MATDVLVPNGWSEPTGTWIAAGSGSPSDEVDAVDEGIASTDGDGSYVSPTNEGDVIIYDLQNTAVVDADTVTSVDIRISAKTVGSGNDSVAIDLLIGGAAQGTQFDTGTLGTGYTTYLAQGATQGWTTDWSQSQLDGMQVQLTAAQSAMPTGVGHRISTVEVTVNYTLAPTGGMTSAKLAGIPGRLAGDGGLAG